jgi:hypothetical protein
MVVWNLVIKVGVLVRRNNSLKELSLPSRETNFRFHLSPTLPGTRLRADDPGADGNGSTTGLDREDGVPIFRLGRVFPFFRNDAAEITPVPVFSNPLDLVLRTLRTAESDVVPHPLVQEIQAYFGYHV